ncbi:hypothetical protein LBMAG53_37520 [Planctomycetota bacterium]|nr:hypothetical protein LBMAG53_37520 [Planctomycetota bacterium]
MPVHVLVRARALPGQGDALHALLREHAAASRGEPGCLAYTALRASDDPLIVATVELWADQAAFAAHMQSAHTQINLPRLVALLDGAPDLRVFEPL